MAPIRVIRVIRGLKSSFLGVNPKGTVGELLALSTNSPCCRFSAAQPGSVTKRTGPNWPKPRIIPSCGSGSCVKHGNAFIFDRNNLTRFA